jgi:hypothetical protein
MDRRFALWAEWLGREGGRPSIQSDVVGMLASRHVWDSFNIAYGEASTEARKNATFQSWLTQNYLRAQGLGVRRQTDTRDDVISLSRLIQDVAEYPQSLSRDQFYLETSGHNSRKSADAEFGRVVGPGAFIDPHIPTTDLADLRSRTKKVRTMVTKEYARYDPGMDQFSQGVTFGDLHSAIDVIVQLARKYRSMILGTDFMPEVMMTPWEGIFTVPWIDRRDLPHVMNLIDDKRRERLDALFA